LPVKRKETVAVKKLLFHQRQICFQSLWAVFILLFSAASLYSQNPEWINYTNGNSVSALAVEGTYIWAGTTGGLVKIDKTSGASVFYNKSNSGLSYNGISSIAIDGSGNKWIGTGGGLTRFDGTNWTTYTTANSGLPDNSVRSIAIDGSGNKWIGTDGGGLARFDGTNWAVYTTSNSGLPNNFVHSIAIDGSGNKWIGTYSGGLAVFKEGGIVSVQEIQNSSSGIPKKFALGQNYPNPFNPVTMIRFEIPKASEVKITVYNILGERVKTLVSGYFPAGSSSVQWNGTNEAGIRVCSGIYVYQMIAGNTVITRRMILIK
jgi:hypothetical protein